jgi:hypothetical protein
MPMVRSRASRKSRAACMSLAKAGSVDTLGMRSSAFSRSNMAGRSAIRCAITRSGMANIPRNDDFGHVGQPGG